MATTTMRAIMSAPTMRLRCRQRINRAFAPERARDAIWPPEISPSSVVSAFSRSNPTTAIVAGSQTDPRIEEGVDDVGEQIDEDHQDGEDERCRLHKWVVASGDGVDQKLAGPWQTEDVLDDDCAAQEIADREPEQCQRRNQRIAQNVGRDDRPLPQPLRARGPHVI